MFKGIDLTGRRFGRLVVREIAGRDRYKYVLWKCVCSCGAETTVRSSQLLSGKTKSCGCLAKDKARTANTTHGKSNTRMYHIWLSMRSRCFNKNNRAYKYYGARGIKVCEEWSDFDTFYCWAISNGYSTDLTIDRIDSDGDYCPGNCRWVSMVEQNNNRRNNVVLEYKGETHTVSEWARRTGLPEYLIRNRKLSGWSNEEIFNGKQKSKSS